MWIFILVMISVLATWWVAKDTYEQEIWEVKSTNFISTIKKLINEGFIEKEKGEEILKAYQKSLYSYPSFEQNESKAENLEERPQKQTQYDEWELQEDETRKDYNEPLNQPSSYTEPEKPKYEPEKPLTQEEIKQRNINWILNSGVVLILLAGILFATTNWEVLGNITKAILFTMVGGLFFGVSVITEKVLKINKTSFAFWILGSLFLPLAFLGYEFFGVFGEYFSITGHGRFILGVIGALVCFPVYVYSAYKYKNRIFSWISLINITVGVIFLALSFYPTRDIFYFLLIVYNAILLIVNIKLKKYEKLKIFTDETNLFVQANLALTTATTLYSFDSTLMNSINALICAGLYMFAILTINLKDYTYLFNILFAYSMYSIISNSVLQSGDVVFYALIGIIFAGFATIFRKDQYMRLSFLIASGTVATVVFGGMAYQMAMDFASANFSILNLISYMIIAANYLYLGIKSKEISINAFFPISLLMVALEVYRMLNHYFGFNHIIEFMFGACFVLFVGLYVINNIGSLKYIRSCSGAIYAIGMFLLAFGQLANAINISATVMVSLFTLVLYTLYRMLKNTEIYDPLRYLIPSSLFVALFSLYYSVHLNISFAVYFAICSLIVFWLNSLQFVIKNDLSQPYFWVGHGLLIISAITFYTDGINGLWFFAILSLTYIYSYIIYPKEISKVFLYLGFITLNAVFDNLFRLITNNSVMQYIDLPRYSLFCSAVCVIIYYFITKNENIKKHIVYYLTPVSAFVFLQTPHEELFGYWSLLAFFVALIYMYYRSETDEAFNAVPLVLLLLNNIWAYGQLFNDTESLVIAIIQVSILMIIGCSKKDYVFSYGHIDVFSIFALLNIIFLPHFDLYQYVSLCSAICVGVYYFAADNENIKKHIAYYLTPVSVVAFLQSVNIGLLSYVALVLFFAALIYMYYRSEFSTAFNIVPLTLLLISNTLAYHQLFTDIQVLFIALIQIAALVVIGYKKHDYLFDNGEADIFNIFALLNIIFLPHLDLQSIILSDLVKPVLLSGWLYIQTFRQADESADNTAKMIFTLSLLWPYYSLIFNLNIPGSIAAFVYSLPIIIVTYTITRFIYSETSELKFFEYAAQIFVYLYILSDSFYDVEKGIIFGLILILGIIISNSLRWKSLFIGTNAMLLINVFVQTREFWLNIPWWIYLLTGGLVLIITASMNELGDIKGNTINSIKERFKDWE